MLNPLPLAVTPYVRSRDMLTGARILLTNSLRLHLHLDWQPFDLWLHRPGTTACQGWQDGRLVALMAASPPDEATCWLRVVALESGVPVQSGLAALWDCLRHALAAAGLRGIYALGGETWLDQALAGLGFARDEEVVTLRRLAAPHRSVPLPHAGLAIRQVQAGDLDAVLTVDHAAFAPPWRLEAEDLAAVLRQPVSFSLAERSGRVVAYEVSMQHGEGAHVTRLATAPDVQGQGIGGALLGDVLRRLDALGVPVTTLNTQRSNTISQRLYLRSGFEFTSYSLPVWRAEP